MARLDSLRRIGAELYQVAPDWGRKLFDTLNPFIDEVFNALQRRLTFQENFAGAIREFTFETKANYTAGVAGWDAIRFGTGLKVKAIGCVILQVNEVADNDPVIIEPVTLNWVEVAGADGPEIVIRYVAGLANSKKYSLRAHAF